MLPRGDPCSLLFVWLLDIYGGLETHCGGHFRNSGKGRMKRLARLVALTVLAGGTTLYATSNYPSITNFASTDLGSVGFSPHYANRTAGFHGNRIGENLFVVNAPLRPVGGFNVLGGSPTTNGPLSPGRIFRDTAIKQETGPRGYLAFKTTNAFLADTKNPALQLLLFLGLEPPSNGTLTTSGALEAQLPSLNFTIQPIVGGPVAALSTLPEPASLGLMGIGLVGVSLLFAKKRMKSGPETASGNGLSAGRQDRSSRPRSGLPSERSNIEEQI